MPQVSKRFYIVCYSYPDMVTKSGLAIKLSKLPVFIKGNLTLEQYPTDSEIAAESLWAAYMNGDIEDKIIADLGAGTGILGIGALELGAKFVYFVEKDKTVIEQLEANLANYDKKNYAIINSDISDFKPSKGVEIDTVIMNPPFGTKKKHSDREFLIKAFSLSNKVYSFHKTSTSGFIESISSSSGFRIVIKKDFEFPLKQTYSFHKSKIKRIEVSLFYMAKN
jgi:putative methylase